ncbi:hypothetical protein [Parvularcula maris]|uniref:DUF3775 domain-containing protein n=1 Tax=Parvularcula maris TaxID=2965077 RepID=A0A9X2RJD6_9PROT|nr:hypothetical protein [Parvularcula maris]MCQ8185806.1 hypothetical protein [Parvularcula maris]
MANKISLNVSEEDVRAFAVMLKRYHAKEMMTGQNDGSNDTDMIEDNLELSDKEGEFSDARGLYGEMNASQRLDLAALTLLGMDEADDFEGAMQIAKDRGGPDLDAFREMPLSPDLMLEGLERVSPDTGTGVAEERPVQ